ncbi:sigma-54 interaction domain-containing protein [Desulfocucumis palustris]|uniref:sigma-54 interaction domain-containing protein n=1 Tax=Desulfocucumis palustris TaxID=1898651 RepID=UPI000CE9D9A6|nr:sigma 54-interacting transcriptional regulator [Desulfocucumis palustris]
MLHSEKEHNYGNAPRREVFTAERLMQTIFSNNHEALLVVTRDGVISQISASLAQSMNRQPSQLIGLPLSDLNGFDFLKRLESVLDTGSQDIGQIELLAGRSILVDYIPIMEGESVSGALAKVTFYSPDGSHEKEEGTSPRGKKKARQAGPGILYTVDSITGSSPQMLDLKETLLKISPRISNVLISGESGTGKELFAHAVHAASLRRSGPFIKINCAAIPENLLESEFFGYEDGAFTGGKKGGQLGKLELAHGGTVFLDEIGELPFSLQAKLLRFIQEKEIQKLGGREVSIADVRVVVATNVNLEHLVKYKKFREDLYYRLNVVNLTIPPLRERKEDIPELVDKFVDKFNKMFGFKVTGVAKDVMLALQKYSWPGNVRELENVIERSFNVMDGNKIMLQHLPSNVSCLPDKKTGLNKSDNASGSNFAAALMAGHSLEEIMDQTEKLIILQALMICQGNKARTSQLLNISRPGLYKKLIKYGLV